MLLESTILDGRVVGSGRVGSGRGLDDNNTNSAQQELGLGLSLTKYTDLSLNKPYKNRFGQGLEFYFDLDFI